VRSGDVVAVNGKDVWKPKRPRTLRILQGPPDSIVKLAVKRGAGF
jgi:hypothetical protein